MLLRWNYVSYFICECRLIPAGQYEISVDFQEMELHLDIFGDNHENDEMKPEEIALDIISQHSAGNVKHPKSHRYEKVCIIFMFWDIFGNLI